MNPDNIQSQKLSTTTETALEILYRSSPEDFDGHTGFDRMTPAARLAWLETAVEFVTSANARQRPCSRTSTQSSARSLS